MAHPRTSRPWLFSMKHCRIALQDCNRFLVAQRRTTTHSALVVVLLLLGPASIPGAVGAEPTTTRDVIAVIGTGNVGGVLGSRLARAGYTVVYGTRKPEEDRIKELVARSGRTASAALPATAAAQADVVVLAVPWRTVEEVIPSLGRLAGKIVVDTTNGADSKTIGTSGGEMIQSWATGAAVVKAFNTVSAKVMADPGLAQGPVTIPLAGDNKSAKSRVAKLVEALGFDAYDVGPITHARVLEAMARMYIDVQLQERPDAFNFYFRSHPRLSPLESQRRAAPDRD